MAVTKIKDVVQPDLFAQYVIDKTTEKSEIMNAGVVQNNPTLNQLITGGGTIYTMPKWNDLGGKSQVLREDEPISVDKITSKSENATLLIRAGAWGAHELAGAMAGSDPMKAIGNLVSDWWVRDEKSNLMSILNGIFASTAKNQFGQTMADLTLNETTKTISANMVLDGKQLMGDASDLLTMLYMHSATFTELQKQNVIQFIPAAESKISIPTYLGYRVVFDDSAPITVADGTKGVYSVTLASPMTAAGTAKIGINNVEYEFDSSVATKELQMDAFAAILQASADITKNFDVAHTTGTAVITFTQKNAGMGEIVITFGEDLFNSDKVKTETTAIAGNRIYTTYLLSSGVIQRGIGRPITLTEVETDRDSLGSTDYLINRQAKVLHPKGISWIGSADTIDGPTPSDAELATGTNWKLISDIKKLGIVKINHLLSA